MALTFFHSRQLTPVDRHFVQRPNRDTLYSTEVFDLDARPVTITLPDAGKRFLTMVVIDEDHDVFTVVYGAGGHTLARAKIGTRYALGAIRILVDPSDPQDVAQSTTCKMRSRSSRNDGSTIHKLNVEDVPVDGFWRGRSNSLRVRSRALAQATLPIFGAGLGRRVGALRTQHSQARCSPNDVWVRQSSRWRSGRQRWSLG